MIGVLKTGPFADAHAGDVPFFWWCHCQGGFGGSSKAPTDTLFVGGLSFRSTEDSLTQCTAAFLQRCQRALAFTYGPDNWPDCELLLPL